MTAAPRIYIADHEGMVGAAILRQLRREGHPVRQLITRSRGELDLGDQAAVQALLLRERPEQIYLPLPGLNGSLPLPDPQGDRFLHHLQVLTQVIGAARRCGVHRLVFIGSAHVYPPQTIVPRAEEDLLTAPPSTAHQSLALAQTTAIRLCWQLSHEQGGRLGIDYRSLISAPLFGPGDEYFGQTAGSIARLIRRLHTARLRNEPVVRLGSARNEAHEFIFVQDLASAACHLMDLDDRAYRRHTLGGIGHLNAGHGRTCSLPALAHSVAAAVGYRGRLECQLPPGPTHTGQLLDSHRLRATGWRPLLGMDDALSLTYYDYLARTRARATSAGSGPVHP